MAVDDHGLEVLKKAGLDLSGDRSNYALQMHVASSSLGSQFGIDPRADYIEASYPDPETEIYLYKEGGAAGTPVQRITIVYADAEHTALVSAFSEALP